VGAFNNADGVLTFTSTSNVSSVNMTGAFANGFSVNLNGVLTILQAGSLNISDTFR